MALPGEPPMVANGDEAAVGVRGQIQAADADFGRGDRGVEQLVGVERIEDVLRSQRTADCCRWRRCRAGRVWCSVGRGQGPPVQG